MLPSLKKAVHSPCREKPELRGNGSHIQPGIMRKTPTELEHCALAVSQRNRSYATSPRRTNCIRIQMTI